MFWTITYYIDSYGHGQRGRSDYLVTQGAGLEEMIQVLTGLRHEGKCIAAVSYTTADSAPSNNPPCIPGERFSGLLLCVVSNSFG